ncbi:MAG: DNA cytosine methyltransferase [Candidatus Omnitrophica bacterium]|nr:DNA cytosine methyltransferase [Candidatus Omnitrophota bacterium]
MEKYRFIDLFAGCGGLCDGFEQTGLFEHVASVEWEKAPRDTLVKRLRDKWGYADAEYRAVRFDIQRTGELFKGWADDPVYGSSIGLDNIISKSGHIDLIIGGPPCQAYSVAGRIRDEHGMQNDYRNYLFECYLKAVDRYRPKVFVFENVEGILSARPNGIAIIEKIRHAFSDHGYELISDLRGKAVIDLSHFGIPQRRTRVILVGLRKQTFGRACQAALADFYDNILQAYRSPTVATVRKAIGDLDALYPTPKDCRIGGKMFSHKPESSGISNHTPRYHNRRDIGIFGDLAGDIESGRNRYAGIIELQKLYTERTGKTSNVHKYYVLRWAQPSNTIPAHLYKDGLRHIHPDPKQARSITVREAARLQAFDDDFEFIGSMGDQYKMIGNAVPPLFAKILAEAIYDFIRDLQVSGRRKACRRK